MEASVCNSYAGGGVKGGAFAHWHLQSTIAVQEVRSREVLLPLAPSVSNSYARYDANGGALAYWHLQAAIAVQEVRSKEVPLPTGTFSLL